MDFKNFTKNLSSCNMWYYYMFGDNEVLVTEFSVVLNDKVDGEILKHAVEKVSARLPHLLVEVKKTDNGLMLVHNDRPVVVKESKTAMTLCAEESNYHLWAVFYSENKISFEAHHGLMDGRGAMPLRSAVIYYYCKERYNNTLIAPSIVRTIESELNPEEYAYPFEKAKLIPEYDSTPLPAPNGKKLYFLRDDQKLNKASGHCITLEIPQDEFMAFCKKNGGSPNTMAILLLAQIYESHKTIKDKEISMRVYVDFRNRLGIKLSNEPSVGTLNYFYDDGIKSLPLPEQNAKIRAAMKESVSDENMLSMIKEFVGALDSVEAADTISEKQKISTEVFESLGCPICVSYSGKSEWGDLEKYLKAIYIAVKTPYETLVEINSLNGKFFMNFINLFTDDVYVREFMKILEDNGVPSKIIDEYDCTSGKVGYSI